ncbi:DUF3644 domain-containing protein [Sphingomonas sp. LR55]|uniref:DUF3644 domain-containing protein n=1 Tax=Sphingomonas sp. LR55 TaxID=3050231 RepID=UPI002FE3340A
MNLKLFRDARTLKGKSISSLKTAMTAFNSYDDEGRVTMVLMHLQHACEMLLKAVLVQRKVKVFDRESGMSISFDRCVRLCSSDHGLLSDEAGIMRTVDSLRNAAQHWFLFHSEDLLYLHTRALITAFDAYLKRTFETDLYSHIPPRVLPVSTKPPGDFDFLIDREYQLIGELLEPGRRKRDEGRGRIRSMLAMEAMVADHVEVSERDIDRIEKAVRAKQAIADVFPRLTTIGTSTEGEGTTFTVKFSKRKVRRCASSTATILRPQLQSEKSTYRSASICARRVSLNGWVSTQTRRRRCVICLGSTTTLHAITFSNSTVPGCRAIPTTPYVACERLSMADAWTKHGLHGPSQGRAADRHMVYERDGRSL